MYHGGGHAQEQLVHTHQAVRDLELPGSEGPLLSLKGCVGLPAVEVGTHLYLQHLIGVSITHPAPHTTQVCVAYGRYDCQHKPDLNQLFQRPFYAILQQ